MNSHNFTLCNCDTDSIMFCKADMSPFTEEEQTALIEEINSLLPEKINMSNDGYFKDVLIVKAKNYVLDDGKKRKVKGSALKAPMKEKALREFITEVIDKLLSDKPDELITVYRKYVNEIFHITDISRWVVKKTITKAVLNPKRTNEQKVFDAIQGTDYREGDKAFFYFDVNRNLKLQENYNKDHDVDSLLKKLFKTIEVFKNVLDVSKFPNYSLKNILIVNEARAIAGLEPIVKEKKTRAKNDK
jgi:hypothetical protein